MDKNSSKSQINRGSRLSTEHRRYARIDLGNTRKESIGEWLFNHRIGLLVVFAVFVLSGTVLATASYHVERTDIEYIIEIVPEDMVKEEAPETQPTDLAEELYQRMENVRNTISNDAAQHEASSGSSDIDKEIEQILNDAMQGADSQSSIDEGATSVAGEGESGTGGGDDKGDSKSENDKAGKYQGTCTVNYCFTDPVRNHKSLYIPAYTARGGGVVVLDVTLDRNGAVTNARVASSTNSSLNQIAIQAARNYKTRFNIDGSAPASHKGTITYTFVAQ